MLLISPSSRCQESMKLLVTLRWATQLQPTHLHGTLLSRRGLTRPAELGPALSTTSMANPTCQVLINQLLAFAHRPMLVWVGVSTRLRENFNQASWPRTSDAAHAHHPVTRHWGVPQISVMDAFGPFSTPERDAWLRETYLTDGCCHGTRLAQVRHRSQCVSVHPLWRCAIGCVLAALYLPTCIQGCRAGGEPKLMWTSCLIVLRQVGGAIV